MCTSATSPYSPMTLDCRIMRNNQSHTRQQPVEGRFLLVNPDCFLRTTIICDNLMCTGASYMQYICVRLGLGDLSRLQSQGLQALLHSLVWTSVYKLGVGSLWLRLYITSSLPPPQFRFLSASLLSPIAFILFSLCLAVSSPSHLHHRHVAGQ